MEPPAERSERPPRDVARVRSSSDRPTPIDPRRERRASLQLSPQLQRFAVRKSIPSIQSIPSMEPPAERSERPPRDVARAHRTRVLHHANRPPHPRPSPRQPPAARAALRLPGPSSPFSPFGPCDRPPSEASVNRVTWPAPAAPACFTTPTARRASELHHANLPQHVQRFAFRVHPVHSVHPVHEAARRAKRAPTA